MAKRYDNIEDIECVEYIPNFLPKDCSMDMIKQIINEVDFLSDEKSSIMITGKKINIPRKQCWYGDEKTSYKFSGVKIDGKNWNSVPILNKSKEYIHEKLKVPVNYLLVNMYRDGNDYIGWHSDD